MSNPRRRSILKTRNSVGVFDQTQTTNDLFAETFQIPSNDPTTNLYPPAAAASTGELPTSTNTTTTLPILKRRVSFSSKNQIKDISVESSDQSGDMSNFDSPSMDLNKTTRDAEDIDMELTGCDLNETTDQQEQIDHHSSTINNMNKDMSIDDINKDDSTTRFDLLDLINQTYRSVLSGSKMETTNNMNTNRHDDPSQINNNRMSIENINKNESTKLSLKPMDLTKPVVSCSEAAISAIDMDMTDNGNGAGQIPEVPNITNKADISIDIVDKSERPSPSNESMRPEFNQSIAGDKSIILDATDMEMTNCEFNEPAEEKNNTNVVNKTNFDFKTLSFTQIYESSESLKLTNVEVEEILNTMNKDTSIVSNKSKNSLNVQSINDPSSELTGIQAQTEPIKPTGTQTEPIKPTGTQTEPIKPKIAEDSDVKIANCEPPQELRKSTTNSKVQKLIQNLESRSATNHSMKKINVPHQKAFFPQSQNAANQNSAAGIRFPSKMEPLSLFSTAKTPRRPCPSTVIGNSNNNINNTLSKLVTRPQFSITEVQTSPQLMESEFQKWRKQVPRTPQQQERTLARIQRGVEIEIQTTFSEYKDDEKNSSSQTDPVEKETQENCLEVMNEQKSPAAAAAAEILNDENSPKDNFENLQQELSTSTNYSAAEFKNLVENKMSTSAAVESPLKDISNNRSPISIVYESKESDLIKDKVDEEISTELKNHQNESYLNISHFPESIQQVSSATFQLSTTCGEIIIQQQNISQQYVEMLRDVTHNVTPPTAPKIDKIEKIIIENEDVQMDEIDINQTLMNKSENNLSSVLCNDVNSPAHKKFRMQLTTPQKAFAVLQPKPQQESESAAAAVKVHKVSSVINLTAEKLTLTWKNLTGFEKIEAIEKAHRNIVKLSDEEFEKLLEDSKEDFNMFLVNSLKRAREYENLLENTPCSSEDPRIKDYLQVWNNDNYFSTLAI